jgi:hypothetical protein
LISQLGITKVISGSTRKDRTVLDAPTSPKSTTFRPDRQDRASSDLDEGVDPYAEVKRMGIYEEVPSLDQKTTENWFKAASFVLFSPPGAVGNKNWEILEADHTLRAKNRASSVPTRGRETTADVATTRSLSVK